MGMAHPIFHCLLPEPLQGLVQEYAALFTTLAWAMCLAAVFSFALGPSKVFFHATDKLKGVYELLRHGLLIRAIDLSRLAASVRGEDSLDELHHDQSTDMKPNHRTTRRTIRDLRPGSTVKPGTSTYLLNPSTAIHYAGLVNSSSNTCFLNAVLQALASMPRVIEYLNMIHSHSYPDTSVVIALREILIALNTPRQAKTTLRPVSVAQALFRHGVASGNKLTLFNLEQQDAQEFFVTVIDAIEAEAQTLADHVILEQASQSFSIPLRPHAPPKQVPSLFDVTSAGSTSQICLSRMQLFQKTREILRSPFRGLMAHRIACGACGFTSTIRHSAADHFSLNVPPKATCRLEDCLAEYTKLELLEDYICQKCSLIKTCEDLNRQYAEGSAGLSSEASVTNSRGETQMTPSKKKRLQKLKSNINKLNAAIEEDPERELGNRIVISRVASLVTTKQTMFARPPDALTFHISRSTAYAQGVSFKNHCQVIYPEFLNLDPFCTNAELSRDADAPISTSRDPCPGACRHRYQLSSVVVHYGSHSFGHYITFRRTPRALTPPHFGTIDDPSSLVSQGENCITETASWYRISDETVQVSSLEEALRANPFLLMYELMESGSPSRQRSTLDQARELSWFELS